MLGYRRREFQIGEDGFLSDVQIGEGAGLALGLFLMTSEYEVENHFQFQLYSNSFPGIGNDQSHSSFVTREHRGNPLSGGPEMGRQSHLPARFGFSAHSP